MRIVSGSHKGRYIPVRKNFNARPTTDFAKENLFNILSNNFNFEKIEVLDLFSGTGSISYEFASRGCKKILSVEKDYRSCEFIRTTAKNLNLDSIKCIKTNVFKFINSCKESYDIVFADPPYDLDKLVSLPAEILKSGIIKNNGWLLLEHGKNHQFSEIEELIDTRKYGSVHFSIFEVK